MADQCCFCEEKAKPSTGQLGDTLRCVNGHETINGVLMAMDGIPTMEGWGIIDGAPATTRRSDFSPEEPVTESEHSTEAEVPETELISVATYDDPNATVPGASVATGKRQSRRKTIVDLGDGTGATTAREGPPPSSESPVPQFSPTIQKVTATVERTIKTGSYESMTFRAHIELDPDPNFRAAENLSKALGVVEQEVSEIAERVARQIEVSK